MSDPIKPNPFAVIQKMQGLTDEQDALVGAAQNGKSITGKARAGAGKTFIIKIIAKLFPNKKILYVTFSKLLVEDAKKAGMPSNVNIVTAHGLSYKPARKFYCPTGKLNISDYTREQNLFEYLQFHEFDIDTGDETMDALGRENRMDFLELVKFCRLNMAQSEEQIHEVCQYYGINLYDYSIDMFNRARQFFLKPSATISFTDMIHTPVSMNLPMDKYDLILADEVQDSSLMIMNLYKQCLVPGGQIVCVGDDKQAIYGFAGSRNEALQIFSEFFQTETMPLSVNFRCGKHHIELAQTIVPDIMAHDKAIDGEVVRTDDNTLKGLKDGDLIICRRVAPLVGPCLSLVKAGQKAMIKGRDIAAPIISILKKCKNCPDTNRALDKIISMEEADLRIAEKRKYKKATTDAIAERYGIAKYFLMEEQDVELAIKRIYGIFSDENEGIVFSSVHKAKGLEADNVTVLEVDKIRMNKPDMLPWQHEQEANLEYVAYTRPKLKLTLIASPQHGSQQDKDSDEE